MILLAYGLGLDVEDVLLDDGTHVVKAVEGILDIDQVAVMVLDEVEVVDLDDFIHVLDESKIDLLLPREEEIGQSLLGELGQDLGRSGDHAEDELSDLVGDQIGVHGLDLGSSEEKLGYVLQQIKALLLPKPIRIRHLDPILILGIALLEVELEDLRAELGDEDEDLEVLDDRVELGEVEHWEHGVYDS